MCGVGSALLLFESVEAGLRGRPLYFRTAAGFPSGQRGLTVNQVATPSKVRILLPPLPRPLPDLELVDAPGRGRQQVADLHPHGLAIGARVALVAGPREGGDADLVPGLRAGAVAAARGEHRVDADPAVRRERAHDAPRRGAARAGLQDPGPGRDGQRLGY